MSLLSVSVFGSSRKKNEQRVPIHPDQIEWIEQDVRNRLIFEEDYGLPFGMANDELAQLVGGLATREELFQCSDIMLMPKPVQEDIDSMQDGSILWGWPHCVQQQAITQSSIDHRLTLIAWEAMHSWSTHGDWQMHTFNKNNEIAGYAGVLHAFELLGINGTYGPERKAIILSFGSVSRGAIHALRGLGVDDITVYTQRQSTPVADQIAGIEYRQFAEEPGGKVMAYEENNHTANPFIDDIADADIIVNGILQDTNHPLMFVFDDEKDKLKPGSLIIDVSCDEGMGFEFAKPTTFSNPMFKVGRAQYYAVDHAPSYLWNSASWEISKSLLPYLPIVMGGPDQWSQSETIKRAIEISNGVIQNPDILSFQNREIDYPHQVKR